MKNLSCIRIMMVFIFLFFISLGLSAEADQRISLSGSYIQTQGEFKNLLPYGIGLNLGYIGLSKEKPFYFPGLQLETGYFNYNNQGILINGVAFSAGPVWRFYLFSTQDHLELSLLYGYSTWKVKTENLNSFNNTSLIQYSFGYTLPFENLAIFLQARYVYAFDQRDPLHGFGINAGISFKLR